MWHAIHEIELCFNTKELKDICFVYDDLVDPAFRKETFKSTIIELIKKGEAVRAIKLLVNICKRHNLHSKYLNGLIFYLRHNKRGIEIRKILTVKESLLKHIFNNMARVILAMLVDVIH